MERMRFLGWALRKASSHEQNKRRAKLAIFFIELSSS
jgi:hypothetical protein